MAVVDRGVNVVSFLSFSCQGVEIRLNHTLADRRAEVDTITDKHFIRFPLEILKKSRLTGDQ